ncbi:hypothetical protein BDV59DRAFT_190711 [Aspergillus ambiguus]|uniref:uncharacterized protein n=1 Tax=Aspergillus ambiguus TaxID=176160 RepID=UPI003CCCFF13
MEGPNILFLTNSEHGQASVTLAVAHELLLQSDYSIHIASFRALAPEISKLNAVAASGGPKKRNARFHAIPGLSMLESIPITRMSCFSGVQIGFRGALEALKALPRYVIPWSGAEYIAIYHAFVDIIEALQPVTIILDPLLPQARDACRMMGVEDRIIILSPNTAKELVVQPRLENLWKYPMLGSGYPFPLPLWLILPNIFLALRAACSMVFDKNIKEVTNYRKDNGIDGGMPTFIVNRDDPTQVLLPNRPEMDFPVFAPQTFTGCGPILRPWIPVADSDSELNAWLSQRPTVVVNLGSIVRYTSADEKQFAEGLRILLDQRPDIQVLWKLQRAPSTDDDKDCLENIADAIAEGRVRIEKWFSAEPISILLHEQVQCSVHHGGANSYYEAVRAGVPQIVLPVWFDTFDYAQRVEYLGIGVWGSRKTAPAVQGQELGEALVRVLVSDEGTTMQKKAKTLVSQLGPKEGRVVASSLIIHIIMASERVAWIGLGNIGRGMSRNIALKGPQSTPLILYNRTTAKASAFAESLGPNKATVAETLPSAVRDASITFICVGDDPAIDSIVNTLVSDSSLDLSGKIIVDCSTVHPDTSRRTHSALTTRGAAFIACPVFGAPNAADAGQMVVVPAGDAAAINRIKPFLEGVTSKAIIDMSGEEVGRALTLKVLGNTFILNMVETLAEGLVVAEKSGLGREVYRQWVHMFSPGPFAKYADRMCTGDYYQREEPLFAVDLARKDLRHAASLASDANMRLRSVEVTDGYLKQVKEEKGEKGDIAGVYGAIRKESGLPFGNQ